MDGLGRAGKYDLAQSEKPPSNSTVNRFTLELLADLAQPDGDKGEPEQLQPRSRVKHTHRRWPISGDDVGEDSGQPDTAQKHPNRERIRGESTQSHESGSH